MTGTRKPAPPSAEVAELAARSAALRQAASSPGAEPGELLEAALADLEGAVGPAGAVEAITRRLDLVAAVARLLLQNEGLGEHRTLQRCARLIAGELNALVIVDLERRHRLRRQLAVGPDDLGPADRVSPAAAVDPPPESLPYQVYQAGHSALIAYAEDAGLLGVGADGEPLLVTLNATSVLCVPLFDGETKYGALTLARPAGAG